MSLNGTRNYTLTINDTPTTIPAELQLSRTGEQLVFVIIIYSIIILLSIIGNVIVVIAILRVQRLRQPTNFILMSLAIADLLVTTTVMIPGFITEIRRKWLFGQIICKIWVANDITFCTASILHLVAVSFDRYMAIENPLRYKQKMTKRKIFIIIGCIWLISVLLSYGPVLLGFYSQGSLPDKDECNMRPNLIYSIISASTSFYIPLIIILFLYGRIFITARQHSHELQKLENIIKRLHSDQKFVLDIPKWKKNLKAIRTLGIVVGVFVACWLPFFVMYLLLAYCKYKCGRPDVERYITWFGYANSFCNPMIYAFSNKDAENGAAERQCRLPEKGSPREFRHAFAEILNYQNCRRFPLSRGLRSSMTKSVYSLNIRTTPLNHSRHASVTPYSNALQRNGHLSYTVTSLCSSMPRAKSNLAATKNSVDGIEMQGMAHPCKTDEAFHELEHLVPNGVLARASIVRMSSIIQDPDDPASESSTPKQSRLEH